jgi:hypothetical protein
MLYTSWKLALEYHACKESLNKWRTIHSKIKDDDPIPLDEIIDVLGLSSALWALNATTDKSTAKIVAIKFGIACSERILIYLKALRNVCSNEKCDLKRKINVVRRYLLNPSEKSTYISYSALKAISHSSACAAARFVAKEKSIVIHPIYDLIQATLDLRTADATYQGIVDDCAYVDDTVVYQDFYDSEIEWQNQKLKELLSEGE